jgi:hypothetical protein
MILTKGFVKQIKLVLKANDDDDDDSPQHPVHHNRLRDLRITIDFLTSLRTWGSSSLNQLLT